MKKLARSFVALALLFLILYSLKSHGEIGRLRAQVAQRTQPGRPGEDSHPGPASEHSNGEPTQGKLLDATGSPRLNRAEDTSERRLNDFLTLIDRCGEDNVWRSQDTLMTFRMSGMDVQRFLPQEQSVVYAVDQALRELRFDPLRLDVKLHRQDKTKSSLDYMDVYESRNENTIRIKTIPDGLHPGHLDSKYFEARTINHVPEDSLILEISVQPKGVYQDIYDKWPRRRQREFKQALRAAAEQAIADLAVGVRISVHVWTSSLQAWD